MVQEARREATRPQIRKEADNFDEAWRDITEFFDIGLGGEGDGDGPARL
jgi:hypothetical protein